MTLTDEVYLDPKDGRNKDLLDKNQEDNVTYLTRVLCDHVENTFRDWVVDNGSQAFFVYGQGYGDECRPIEATAAKGSDLHELIRLFAEMVDDGARARCCDDGDSITLDLEIANELFDSGLHISLTEQDVENPFRWTLDELPKCSSDWGRFGKAGCGKKKEKRKCR